VIPALVVKHVASIDEGSTNMTRTRIELGVWQVDG
jgi:hypothetical protein